MGQMQLVLPEAGQQQHLTLIQRRLHGFRGLTPRSSERYRTASALISLVDSLGTRWLPEAGPKESEIRRGRRRVQCPRSQSAKSASSPFESA